MNGALWIDRTIPAEAADGLRLLNSGTPLNAAKLAELADLISPIKRGPVETPQRACDRERFE